MTHGRCGGGIARVGRIRVRMKIQHFSHIVSLSNAPREVIWIDSANHRDFLSQILGLRSGRGNPSHEEVSPIAGP